MRKFFSRSLIFAVMIAMPAMADKPVDKHPLRVGFGMDVGVPSGAALGLVVHPKVDWLTLNLAVTYNALNVGERLSLKLDPMALAPNLPIGLFVDVQGGWALNGTIPGHSDLPGVGYHYANFYGGLRLGKPNGFHWNLEVGPTYLMANVDNLGSVVGDVKGLTFSNPTVRGWVMPTFVTGFEVTW
jgi:hypothetical protein